jgi:UTP--glucose-1-phosphate uridylyltransferase
VVAITKVPREVTSRYGIVRTTRGEGRLWELADVVEKPPVDEAPSDLAVLGRYVLSPRVFDKLEHTPRGAGGEIQLTDAIRALMADQPVYGYEYTGHRYDAGSRAGWLEANVALALESDLADDFRAYLRGLDLRD